jgi:inositol-phosphate transport system permease protein
MIIFTSAIEAIPKDLLNASLVDGSTLIQRVRYIIMPLLRWPLLFVVTYQTLSLLTSFEQILLLTDGGPGLYETEVWALTAYHRALSNYFGNAQWGYGSAFAVMLVLVGVALAVIYMRVFRFQDLVAEPKIEVL